MERFVRTLDRSLRIETAYVESSWVLSPEIDIFPLLSHLVPTTILYGVKEPFWKRENTPLYL